MFTGNYVEWSTRLCYYNICMSTMHAVLHGENTSYQELMIHGGCSTHIYSCGNVKCKVTMQVSL